MRYRVAAATVGLLALSSCHQDHEGTSAPSTAHNMSGAVERRMANCTSTVNGARTSMRERAGGVELLIVADDRDAIAEIQRRARYQAEVVPGAPEGARHTGRGTGGGQ